MLQQNKWNPNFISYFAAVCTCAIKMLQ